MVDRSSTAQALLAGCLSPYSDRALGVGSVSEARDYLETQAYSLVLLDAELEGAMDWLEELGDQSERPAVLLISAHHDPDQEARATLLGAIGYLAKPLSIDRLTSELRIPSHLIPATFSNPVTTLTIDDDQTGEAQVACDVMTLSTSGALIAIPIALPGGTQLPVRLGLAEGSVAMSGVVVESQEPAWGLSGCLGLRFEKPDEESRQLVERFIASRAGITSHAEGPR